MVRDLNCPVKILTGPIIREPDGFAISSRNKYLTDKERSEVPQIFEGLKKIMENYDKGEKNAGALKEILLNKYHSLKHIKMEYADIVDFENLKPLEILNTPSLVAVACRTTESKTRLIDNIVLGGVL
jgi:pantoate--beta-alanine ligase